MALINGTSGNDELFGTSGPDTITGLEGDDTLRGGAGDDTLIGGLGNDHLDGGLGPDKLYGGEGNDTYYINSVSDQAVELLADAAGGVDLVRSTISYTLGSGIEHLALSGILNLAGTGNDLNNTLYGHGGNNILLGLDGHDVLYGEGGQDTLVGGSGNDTLNGGNDNDLLSGDSGDDVLNGGAGTDTVSYEDATAGVRVNLALTGSQNTVGAGSDTLSQVEIVRGSNFNDTLTGNTATNSLYGQEGNDTLTGGLGADFLSGGTGNDRFDYNAVSESLPGLVNLDVIADFDGRGALVGDRIDLTTIDANTLVTGNQAFIWGGPFTAGHLRYVGGVLQGNTDGDAAAEFEIQLAGVPALVVGGAGTDILL